MMKITKIRYTVKGAMGTRHHLTAIATNEGLAEAEVYVKGHEITARVEEEVVSVTEYKGSATDRFTTYFMEGARSEEKTTHYATGTEFSVVYH